MLKNIINFALDLFLDKATDTIQTAQTTFKLWAYLITILFGSIVLAILYGLYAMIF